MSAPGYSSIEKNITNLHKPEPTPDGFLYYIRLKVNNHTYYKLGFTKIPSVYERFSFDGCQDHIFIDRVILLHHFENAFVLEQDIHSFLRKRRLFGRGVKSFPFYNNGQSEIYPHDYLLLDKEQGHEQFEKNLWQINEWVEALPPYSEIWSERSYEALSDTPIIKFLARIYTFLFGDPFLKDRHSITQMMPDYYEARERFYAARGAIRMSDKLRDVVPEREGKGWILPKIKHEKSDEWSILDLPDRVVQPPLTGRETWYEKLWRWEARVAPNWQVFPRDVKQLSEMTCLDFAIRNPDILPPEIGHLKNLRKLSIHGPIRHIPIELGNLLELRELSFTSGEFYILPSSILNLTKLEILDVSSSLLHYLPTELGRLVNLRILDLSANHLSELPDSIGELSKLEELYIGGSSPKGDLLHANPIDRFPSSFSKLQALKKLYMGEGYKTIADLPTIPEEVFDCKNLEVICSRYRIDGRVKKIKKLKKLKDFSASMLPDDTKLREYAKQLLNIDSVVIYTNQPRDGFSFELEYSNEIRCVSIKNRKINEHKKPQ